jgi:hypothetical protein
MDISMDVVLWHIYGAVNTCDCDFAGFRATLLVYGMPLSHDIL